MTPPKTATPNDPATVAKAEPPNPMLQSFMAARNISTPIVAIETMDPAATMKLLTAALNGDTAVLRHDVVRGCRPMNTLGEAALFQMFEIDIRTIKTESERQQHLKAFAEATLSPVEMLTRAVLLPGGVVSADGVPKGGTVLFMLNGHKMLTELPYIQGLWNLRDPFKSNRRMVVPLGPMFRLPDELAGDVTVLEEPLPTRERLAAVVDQQHRNAKLPLPEGAARASALDALVGLPSIYTAENVTAMSLTPRGLNRERLWERKIKAIENQQGLRVASVKGAQLANLKGIDNIVSFMHDLIDVEAFGAIAFIDEGDKAFAGGMSDYSGDSGVAKDQVGQVLSFIEDKKALGVLAAGVAGTGKTELAKAVAATSGKPLIIFDLGGMKTSGLGDSEQRIRACLKLLDAIAEGRILFLVTANKTVQFSPEMNRRFPDQYFFDTPTAEALAAIWPVYIAQYGLSAAQAQFTSGFDEGWNGSEIRRACERAKLFSKTVIEVAKHIIPQAVSERKAIRELREQANGRFMSASYPGLFTLDGEQQARREAAAVEATDKRFITFGPETVN